VSQPDPTGESPVTTAKPPVRYGAIWGRAYGRLCSTELHHHWGHDRPALWREMARSLDCRISRAVVIEPSLRRQSLQNGNIRGCGWRLSPIGALRLPIWESGDEIGRAKSPHSGGFSRFSGNITERRSGWLGREGSNLRMAESKSDRTASNINARS